MEPFVFRYEGALIATREVEKTDDVLAYTEGVFPELDPAGTTLVFGASAAGAQDGTGTVEYRSHWF